MESQFERLLREKYTLMVDMRVEATLMKGLTMEEYQYNLGYIEALRQAIAAMEEIQTEQRQE